jgi:hypothetical protein
MVFGRGGRWPALPRREAESTDALARGVEQSILLDKLCS